MLTVHPRDERPALHRKRNSSFAEPEKDVLLDGNIKLFSYLDFKAEVMCCRFNNNGKLIAIGLANGDIKVYSLNSKSVVYNLHPPEESKLPVTSLRWKPDKADQEFGNVLLAVYASGYVRHWHVSTEKCFRSYKDKMQMMACAYNPGGNHFVVARSDGKIDVHDDETSQIMYTMEPSVHAEVMDGHMMRIFSVLFNPTDDHVFVSGGWDDTVQWWDTRISSTNSIKKIVGPHICGEGIDILPHNLNILTASWRKDHNLQVYDFGSGKILKDLPLSLSGHGDKSMLYCAQWLNRDVVIAGGSHANTMNYVDVNKYHTAARLHGLSGAVYSIDNTRSLSHPVVGICADKTLYLVEDIM